MAVAIFNVHLLGRAQLLADVGERLAVSSKNPDGSLLTAHFSGGGCLGDGGFGTTKMDLLIKSLSWSDSGHYVIVIVWGRFDLRGLELVFTKLAATTRPLPDCKVVIDLQDAWYDLSPAEIYEFANGIAPHLWPGASKIALVAVNETEQYEQIFLLGAFLTNRGLPVSVFHHAKAAVRWLAAPV